MQLLVRCISFITQTLEGDKHVMYLLSDTKALRTKSRGVLQHLLVYFVIVAEVECCIRVCRTEGVDSSSKQRVVHFAHFIGIYETTISIVS